MTLRARLTWILLAVLLPLGLLVGLGLYAFVRASLVARLDDSLSARSEALAATIKWHNGVLEVDPEDTALPQYQITPGTASKPAAFFEMWRLNDGMLGPLIERSKSLGANVLVDQGRLTERGGRVTTWNADLGAGGDADVRVLALRAVPRIEQDDPAVDPGEARAEGKSVPPPAAGKSVQRPEIVPEVLIAVAVPREAVDRPLELLALGLVLAGVVLASAGLAALRWAIGRGLAPVSDLAAQVAGVDADHLGTRLSASRLPPEIAPIQDRVNALLERIDGAMRREKQFTDAAAHELRTPIAELRMLLEVASDRERTSGEWRQTADRAVAVLVRAQHLCESLLRLSRGNAGTIEAAPLVPTDLHPVLAGQVVRAVAVHGIDQRRVRVECPPLVPVLVDPALLGSIIGNLLDNALRHGASTIDNPVIVRCARSSDSVQIAVSNPAPNLAQDDVPHLFDPFWRKDASRHDQRGFGLGLPVARAMAKAINGDLTATLDASNTLTLCLVFRADSGHDQA